MIYPAASLVIALIIISILLLAWFWYHNPCQIITWWNRIIRSECDQQDAHPLNGIPSYHNAWDSSNRTAQQFHSLVSLHHEDILSEVLQAINEYDGLSSEETNWESSHWLKDERKWHPIWIRFMGQWAGSSERVPSLKKIASFFPQITALHVSVFRAGAGLVEHRGPNRITQRYHYCLQVAENDIGLRIAGFDVKWKEREGFVWDDTLEHSAWNHTSQTRIVIFADILREFSLINSIGSTIIYNLMQKSKHVSHIKTSLQEEGLIVR